MSKDMDIKDEIHRLKLECVGGTCSIDDPEFEAFGSYICLHQIEINDYILHYNS